MKNIIRRVATVVAAAAMSTLAVVAVSAPAQAADDPAALGRAKTEVTKRIDLRLAALGRADTRLPQAKRLTDAHEATLHDLIAKDTSGLTALKTKVAGETTVAAVRADAKSMVVDYRIFMLVGPQVRLTIVGDREAYAITRLQGVHDKLAEQVAKAKAAGKNTAEAEQDLADMQADLTKATSDINGQVNTLLGMQPSPEANTLKAQVTSVRRALGAGKADLRAAVGEARQVRKFLKSVAGA